MLDNGRVKEYDTPERLLANRTSLFFSMARDAGLDDGRTVRRQI